MKISEAQKGIIEGLKCLRISSYPNAIRVVEGFNNPLNEILVDYIKGDAFQEDYSGKAACYIIIDDENDILCYFALKSGLLYDEFVEWKEYEKYKKINISLKELVERKNSEEAKKMLHDNEKRLEEAKENLRKIVGVIEAFPLHKQVERSYAAIELSHFCVNDNYRQKWNSFHFGSRNRLGITLFWHFIVDRVINVSQIIGCEFLYLFAADNTPDHFLVNHYKGFMGFREDMKVLSLQPKFDFRCTFLCNSIDAFKKGRENFFLHFNEKTIEE